MHPSCPPLSSAVLSPSRAAQEDTGRQADVGAAEGCTAREKDALQGDVLQEQGSEGVGVGEGVGGGCGGGGGHLPWHGAPSVATWFRVPAQQRGAPAPEHAHHATPTHCPAWHSAPSVATWCTAPPHTPSADCDTQRVAPPARPRAPAPALACLPAAMFEHLQMHGVPQKIEQVAQSTSRALSQALERMRSARRALSQASAAALEWVDLKTGGRWMGGG